MTIICKLKWIRLNEFSETWGPLLVTVLLLGVFCALALGVFSFSQFSRATTLTTLTMKFTSFRDESTASYSVSAHPDLGPMLSLSLLHVFTWITWYQKWTVKFLLNKLNCEPDAIIAISLVTFNFIFIWERMQRKAIGYTGMLERISAKSILGPSKLLPVSEFTCRQRLPFVIMKNLHRTHDIDPLRLRMWMWMRSNQTFKMWTEACLCEGNSKYYYTLLWVKLDRGLSTVSI